MGPSRRLKINNINEHIHIIGTSVPTCVHCGNARKKKLPQKGDKEQALEDKTTAEAFRQKAAQDLHSIPVTIASIIPLIYGFVLSDYLKHPLAQFASIIVGSATSLHLLGSHKVDVESVTELASQKREE